MSDELREIRTSVITIAEVLYDLISELRLHKEPIDDRNAKDCKRDLRMISMAMEKANGATHE